MSSAGLLFITAVFVFTVAPLVQPGTIVNNRIDWGKGGGSAKKFVIGAYVELKWQNARQYCNDHCMELASIRSTAEQHEVVELIKRSEGFRKSLYYWIGGSNTANKAKWAWSGSEDPIVQPIWRPGAPTLGALDNCIALWDDVNKLQYAWRNARCSYEYLFICEHNTTYPYDYV